jgi:hypothetical protein
MLPLSVRLQEEVASKSIEQRLTNQHNSVNGGSAKIFLQIELKHIHSKVYILKGYILKTLIKINMYIIHLIGVPSHTICAPILKTDIVPFSVTKDKFFLSLYFIKTESNNVNFRTWRSVPYFVNCNLFSMHV